MAIRLITAPTVEPVTLAEAKAHLRVDHTNDDSLIQLYIEAGRRDCEEWTGRAFVSQTWELVIDEFPVDDAIQLPKPPLQSVTSIKYDDANGNEQTLSTSEYTADTVSEPGWVVAPSIGGWSPTTFDGINAVRIRFVAGYSPGADSPDNLTANIPQSIKAAILLQVGHLYANRETVVIGAVANPVPMASEFLLRMFRVALGMA